MPAWFCGACHICGLGLDPEGRTKVEWTRGINGGATLPQQRRQQGGRLLLGKVKQSHPLPYFWVGSWAFFSGFWEGQAEFGGVDLWGDDGRRRVCIRRGFDDPAASMGCRQACVYPAGGVRCGRIDVNEAIASGVSGASRCRADGCVIAGRFRGVGLGETLAKKPCTMHLTTFQMGLWQAEEWMEGRQNANAVGPLSPRPQD